MLARITLCALVLFVAGCAHPTNLRVLSPVVKTAWIGVSEDALNGAESAADSSAIGAMNAALEAGFCNAAADSADVYWDLVELCATRGIGDRRADGELGEGGAASR